MSPYRMSKIEESARTAVQFFESINTKNITRINEIIDEKCVFEDLWENTRKCINKNDIITYLNEKFTSTNNITIHINEANNFGHKCIIKFTLTNNIETRKENYDCIGLFEVYSGLIKSINLYTKK